MNDATIIRLIEEYAKKLCDPYSDHEANSQFTPMDKWGTNVDDCFYGGKEQGRYDCGRFLLDVISKRGDRE